MTVTAFVFPGQGSQKVGMGRALVDELPAARRLFEEADDVLGYALSTLCLDGPEAELKRTANTQPAILLASIAALRAVEERAGLVAQVVAGHSLGEYSALVCAGSLRFADALKLVHLRGRLMQEAVADGVGAMAAVMGLDARAVEDCCLEARGGAEDSVCSPANLNGAGQVVIAGHKDAVERAMALAKAKGAKLVKALPVSAPFHCALMAPAAAKLAVALADTPFGPLQIKVVHNVNAEASLDSSQVRARLVEQVTAPVRWEESVQSMVTHGFTHAVEIGPGRVLTGLMKRIAPSLTLANVETPADADGLKEWTHG